MKRRKPFESGIMADINVTPLVDVMLVLLIIFMVTAPMLHTGIEVNLPKVTAKSVDVSDEKIVVAINGAREIYINKYKTSIIDLGAKLESIFANKIEREVFMRADKNVPYGYVVEVMSEIRKAGIDKLGMITEPPEEKR